MVCWKVELLAQVLGHDCAVVGACSHLIIIETPLRLKLEAVVGLWWGLGERQTIHPPRTRTRTRTHWHPHTQLHHQMRAQSVLGEAP